MTVIHAEARFDDKAVMDSIDYKIWHYDRYWLGLKVDQTIDMWNRSPRMNVDSARIERFERLYMDWLVRQGEQVSDRR